MKRIKMRTRYNFKPEAKYHDIVVNFASDKSRKEFDKDVGMYKFGEKNVKHKHKYDNPRPKPRTETAKIEDKRQKWKNFKKKQLLSKTQR